METDYDLIIVGGGCAGYPSAVYASRFNLKTLVIAKEKGGLITTTHLVENYPGFISISGQELADKLEAHVKANNVEILNDTVKNILKKGDLFEIETDISEKKFTTKTVILATGTKHRHLNIKGEQEFLGRGVSYCATCDGFFFKNKITSLIGGSDSAAKEAMVLAQNSSKVYMFIRSYLKAEPINADRLRKIKNIEIIEGVNLKEIVGDLNGVTSIILDKKYNEAEKFDTDGVFIAIGQLPQNNLARNLGVKLNEKGEIIIDRLSKTNIEGVFAAGDVTNSTWKQAIIGSAEGSIAGYSAFEYINKKFN